MDAEYELSAKRVELSVLEAERQAEELWTSEEYQELKHEIARLERELADDEADSDTSRENGLVFESLDRN